MAWRNTENAGALSQSPRPFGTWSAYSHSSWSILATITASVSTSVRTPEFEADSIPEAPPRLIPPASRPALKGTINLGAEMASVRRQAFMVRSTS